MTQITSLICSPVLATNQYQVDIKETSSSLIKRKRLDQKGAFLISEAGTGYSEKSLIVHTSGAASRQEPVGLTSSLK
jgi:hypothetical protein